MLMKPPVAKKAFPAGGKCVCRQTAQGTPTSSIHAAFAKGKRNKPARPHVWDHGKVNRKDFGT